MFYDERRSEDQKVAEKKTDALGDGLPKSLFATDRRTTTALSIFFRRFVLPYTTHASRLFGAGYPNAAPTPTR
jgi:hypothetical protein